MGGTRVHYESYLDEPAVREVCLNCRHADCIGMCDDYRNAVRELLALKPVRRPKPKSKPENRNHGGPRRVYVVDGVAHTLREWAEISGVKYNTLDMRMRRRGMTLAQAITMPVKPVIRVPRTVTAGGETLTIREWAARLGVDRKVIDERIRRGHTPEEAVTMRKAERDGF